jgi:hypothetical protein
MAATVNTTVTAASVSAVKPRVSISVVDPVASVEYALPVAAIDYILLAVSAELDPLNRNPYVADSTVVVDARVIAFAKALADSAAVSDVLSSEFSQALSDAATITEQILVALLIVQAYADSVNTSDVSVLEFGKNLVDQVLVQDQVLNRTFAKALVDSAVVSDVLSYVLSYDFPQALSDAANITEQILVALLIVQAYVDSVNTSDANVLEFGKNLTDQTLAQDQVLNRTFAKAVSDGVAMNDLADVNDGFEFQFEAAFTNVAFISEDLIRDLAKAISDQANVAEQLAIAFEPEQKQDGVSTSDSSTQEFGKAADESITPSDAISQLDSEKPLDDSVSISEVLSKSFETAFFDSVSVADLFSYAREIDTADSTSINDSQVLDLALGRTDTASATDTQSFLFETTVSDTALISEHAVIDFSTSYTESITAADSASLASSLGKSDSVSSSDFSNWSLDKNPSDTPSLSDTLNYDMARSFSDGVGMNDSVGFGFTYTTSFSNVAFASDSSVLGIGKTVLDSAIPDDSGSLISQGYCDLTYFAEDYVGDSRTFT